MATVAVAIHMYLKSIYTTYMCFLDRKCLPSNYTKSGKFQMSMGSALCSRVEFRWRQRQPTNQQKTTRRIQIRTKLRFKRLCAKFVLLYVPRVVSFFLWFTRWKREKQRPAWVHFVDEKHADTMPKWSDIICCVRYCNACVSAAFFHLLCLHFEVKHKFSRWEWSTWRGMICDK